MSAQGPRLTEERPALGQAGEAGDVEARWVQRRESALENRWLKEQARYVRVVGAHDQLLKKLPIEGLSVNRLILDHRFVLDFGDPPAKTYELALETPFRCWSEGQETGRLTDPSDAAQDSRYLGEAITALHRTCTRATSSEEGTLSVEFDNGLRFEVEPAPKYEAWSLAGGDGLKIFALPSGGLSIWSETAD